MWHGANAEHEIDTLLGKWMIRLLAWVPRGQAARIAGMFVSYKKSEMGDSQGDQACTASNNEGNDDCIAHDSSDVGGNQGASLNGKECQ